MEPVSAFAVYSGLAKLSKNQKRRKRKTLITGKAKSRPVVKQSRKMSTATRSGGRKSDVDSRRKLVVPETPVREEVDEGTSKVVNGTASEELENFQGRKSSFVEKEGPSGGGGNRASRKGKTSPPPEKTTLKKSIKKKKVKKSKEPALHPFGLKDKHLVLLEEAKKIVKSKTTSEKEGKTMFSQLIYPHTIDDFMRESWEKRPLYIRKQSTCFESLVSSAIIDSMVRDKVVMYGKHLDVTSYSDGVRETHNPEGRVHAHVMWDYYLNGCSIRLLNPQVFIDELHCLLATLQEYFGCMVGANAYLTPPNSQGFAPHYDDIEAFVIQMEGKKQWRVYEPRNQNEKLPSFSSPNFTDNEIGEPVLEVTLEPGDVLYFPRGFIHQAKTVPGHHSLHLTVSTYQRTAWCDLLEKVLPSALKKASEGDLDFRRGLPVGYLTHAGVGYPKAPRKRELLFHLKKLLAKLEYHIDLDSAVDQMGVQFMHDSLPPVLTSDESKCSVLQGGIAPDQSGGLRNRVQLVLGSRVRLLRAFCCRLVLEDSMVGEVVERQLRLYYNTDNSREYHVEDPQFLVLPSEFCRTVQFLFSSYPSYVPVFRLPSDSDEQKVNFVNDLWERGLLVTDEPLKEIDNIPKQNVVLHLPREVNSETESSSDECSLEVETNEIG